MCGGQDAYVKHRASSNVRYNRRAARGAASRRKPPRRIPHTPSARGARECAAKLSGQPAVAHYNSSDTRKVNLYDPFAGSYSFRRRNVCRPQ